MVKAEPLASRAVGIEAMKNLEYFGLVLRRNADAVVGDLIDGLAIPHLSANVDADRGRP